ncbi:hypothetical protein TNCV_834091 [Trichonephila clavipes]|nr:hypothetical protein TNCV_834091 [Trichonephila clavipes]
MVKTSWVHRMEVQEKGDTQLRSSEILLVKRWLMLDIEVNRSPPSLCLLPRNDPYSHKLFRSKYVGTFFRYSLSAARVFPSVTQ